MKTDLKRSLRAFFFVIVGCFQVVIYFCCNANIFCFVLSDEGPTLFWIYRQTFSSNVANVTVIGFDHFFGGYFS